MSVFDFLENVAWHIENTPGQIVSDIQVARANSHGSKSELEGDDLIEFLKKEAGYIDPDEWLKQKEQGLEDSGQRKNFDTELETETIVTKEYIEENWEQMVDDIIQIQEITDIEAYNKIKPFKVHSVTEKAIIFVWDRRWTNPKEAISTAKNKKYDRLIQDVIYRFTRKQYDIEFIANEDIVNEKGKESKELDRKPEEYLKLEQKVADINKKLSEINKDVDFEMINIIKEMKHQLDILCKASDGKMTVKDYVSMFQSMEKIHQKEKLLEKIQDRLKEV